MRPKKEIKKEKAVKTASPIAVIEPTDVEVVEDTKPLRRRPTNEERADVDVQMNEMRLMAGTMILHFKQAVQRRELDFNQELQLFKEIGKYIGYKSDGNKIAQDVGMDSIAMKYLEINARLNGVGKPASK